MNGEHVTDEPSEIVDVQAVEHRADPNRGFTRRRALQIGAMAGLSAMWAGPSLARAATNSTPVYLRRSSYAGLVGKSFTIDGGSYELTGVADLAGAAKDAALRGHDEAFALSFRGKAGLDTGIHNFSQPEIGSYSMFVSPVDDLDGGQQLYEVVVDRSVGRPADPPDAPGEPKPAMTEAEKEAAAEDLLASTSILEIPGAPAPAKAARKHKLKRKRRHRKAKHVKAKPKARAKTVKPKRKPVGRRSRSRRRK